MMLLMGMDEQVREVIEFSPVNDLLFVLWKVNWKRASLNPGKLIRKHLQWSRFWKLGPK